MKLSRAVNIGIVCGLVASFPISSLVALFYRFPLPMSTYASGTQAVIPSLVAVIFYGLMGGFVIVGGLGAFGGFIAHKLASPEDNKILKSIKKEVGNIERAINLIYEKLGTGGRLLLVGAGTSGRLAVLEAAECPPTFGTPPKLIHAVMPLPRLARWSRGNRPRHRPRRHHLAAARYQRSWL